MSVKLIGIQLTIVHIHFVFLPLRVQEKKTTFNYTAIKLWNDLPREIKNINKEHRFKAAIKNFLIDKMQKSDQSDFVYY